MPNSSIAIQVLPKVYKDEKMIQVIDEVIAHIKSYNVKTVVTPFETVIEGDYDLLMKILKESVELATSKGENSVMAYAKINLAPKGVLTIDEKISKHI